MGIIKRRDSKIVRQIRDFREQLAKSGLVTEEEIMFAQVEEFQATGREHADASFPIYPEHELRCKLWTQDKRRYNVEGDEQELIIGVAHRMKTVDGKTIVMYFEELAIDKTATPAREHQDRLNQGGIKKSKKLKDIEHIPRLKERHKTKLRQIKRRIGMS